MKIDIFRRNFEKDVRCLCFRAGGLRVLHVRYSHAAAGKFGSHKWPAPEIYIFYLKSVIYIIYISYIFIIIT